MTDTPPPGHNRPFPYSKLEAFLARPGMDDAIRRSVLGAVAYYDAAPTLHRDVKDVSRFLLGVLALYLDASGGLTHRRLRELSGKSGILSAGTATAVLLRLQMIGYVTRADAANGHSRPYKPTPAMEAAFRGRMRIEFEALTHLTDETSEMLARFDEPAVFSMLMAMMGDQSMMAAGSPNPDIAAFNALAVRSAGLLILFEVMAKADTGGPSRRWARWSCRWPPSPATIRSPAATCCRCCGISRRPVGSVGGRGTGSGSCCRPCRPTSAPSTGSPIWA